MPAGASFVFINRKKKKKVGLRALFSRPLVSPQAWLGGRTTHDLDASLCPTIMKNLKLGQQIMNVLRAGTVLKLSTYLQELESAWHAGDPQYLQDS